MNSLGTNPNGRVRRLCLALPGVEEKLSHGEPMFFVKKRGFAMMANNHHNDGHFAVWVPVPEGLRAGMIESHPAAYFVPPYVGTKGWVGVELSQVDDTTLTYHLTTAWESVGRQTLREKRSQ